MPWCTLGINNIFNHRDDDRYKTGIPRWGLILNLVAETAKTTTIGKSKDGKTGNAVETGKTLMDSR